MGTINPMGKDITTVKTKLFGRELSMEVNRVGFRSHASVLVKYGDTVVLGTGMVKDHPSWNGNGELRWADPLAG